MSLQVEISSPSKTLYKGVANEVIAPAIQGCVGILPHHTDYITLLESGTITVKSPKETQNFSVSGGLLKVKADTVVILVEAED